MKQDWKPGTMIYPLPAVLVSCGSTEEEYNIITVAWAGTICTNPPNVLYIRIAPNVTLIPFLKTQYWSLSSTSLPGIWPFATDWCGVRSGKRIIISFKK